MEDFISYTKHIKPRSKHTQTHTHSYSRGKGKSELERVREKVSTFYMHVRHDLKEPPSINLNLRFLERLFNLH